MRVSPKFMLMVSLLILMAFISNYFTDRLVYYPALTQRNSLWWYNTFYFSNFQYSQCEVVHIGVVCADYESILQLYAMLKSLYFHRNNPLHLHIIANENSAKHLDTMFTTWDVPQVTVTFYDANTTMMDPWSVPEILKLTFPNLISTYLTNKLIVIDQNLVFADDIYKLWTYFDYFNETQAIGLVDHSSNGDLEKLNAARVEDNHGQHYNTAVILYHLQHLKAFEWKETLIRVAQSSNNLTEQYIINAVVSNHSSMIFRLPCFLNTPSSDCKSNYNSNKLRILQWSSKQNFGNFADHHNYFRTLQIAFFKYNGTLLRRNLPECTSFSENIALEQPNDTCADFYRSFSYQWRILVFFRKFQYTSTEHDVTIVSQLTFERHQILEELGKRWDGPMSITFYVSETELIQCMTFIDNSEILKDRLNIAYHAVFKESYLHHPINLCRNVALKNVVTNYVFLVDIDFIPGKDLYLNVKSSISSIGIMDNKALVVPAFEVSTTFASEFPETKEEVIEMLDKGELFQFLNFRIIRGHGPTNYTKWRTEKTPYKVEWQPRYEPYVVVQRNITQYDQRFVGYGWNKITHIMSLRAQNYDFIVLPDTFIIHKDHPQAGGRISFKNSSRYMSCLENLTLEVINELNIKYDCNLKIG